MNNVGNRTQKTLTLSGKVISRSGNFIFHSESSGKKITLYFSQYYYFLYYLS
jgi:hypothetical protein